MSKKLFLILGVFAAVALNVYAQPANFQNPTATKISGGSATDDPLGLFDDDNTSSGVKASVVAGATGAEREAFNLINRKRAECGLRALAWNGEIANVARIHSQNMAEFKFFSHRGLDNKMVSDRADASRVGRWRAIGENIAFNRGYKDPVARAVELWLDSPAHRSNLLDAGWQESAVGIAVAADGSYYFTQVFLVRK